MFSGNSIEIQILIQLFVEKFMEIEMYKANTTLVEDPIS